MFALQTPSRESLSALIEAWPDSAELALHADTSDAVFTALGRWIESFYTNGYFVPFEWQHELAIETLRSVPLLEKANAGEIRALLVANLRYDRFSAGHLIGLLRSRYLQVALERLVELSKNA